MRTRLITLGALAAAYVITAKLGFTMAFTAAQVTLVWPPSGLSLAALLLLGANAWPGIFLGAFIANVTTNEPVAVALCIASGNTIAAVLAARLIARFAGTGNGFNWLRHTLGVVVYGALLSTLVSASVGAASLCAGGLQPWTAFGPLWSRWWLGDAAGDMLLAPLLLTWSARPRLRERAEQFEALGLVAGLALAGTLVFTRPFATAGPHPLEYMVFPFLIWAALRFGVGGAAIANVVMAAVAVWGTVHGLGPYAIGEGDERLMMLQIFVGVIAGSSLFLGATVSERDAARSRKAGLLEAALDCIISIDHLGRIIEFNPAAEQTFGYSRSEAIGREASELIVPHRLRELHRAGLARLNRVTAIGPLARRFETIAIRADGSEFPVELSLTRLPQNGPPVLTGFLRDITEQKKMVRQLSFRASHDPLTRVFNKAAFTDRLSTAARRANLDGRGDVALLFVDLNRFKSINDTFGHATGDQVLVAVARRLRASIRPDDSLGRIGGDEFAILLDQVDDNGDVHAVLNRIRDTLVKPFVIDGNKITVSASVGIARASRDGAGAEYLLRAADKAMYEVKASGRAS